MNASQIQAAIDALSGPGRVEIPPGVHYLESTLRIARTDVQLVGLGNPVLMAVRGVGDVLRIGSDTGAPIEGVRVEGLTVCSGEDGSSPVNTGHGIVIHKAYRTHMSHVTVLRTALDCVVASDAQWLRTDDCTLTTYHSTPGVVAFRHIGACNNVAHFHSRFMAHGESDIACQIDRGAQYLFSGCDFSGSNRRGIGLRVAGTGYSVAVQNCYFETCGDAGIDLCGSPQSQVLGAQIRGCFFSFPCRGEGLPPPVAIRVGAVRGGLAQGCTFAGETFDCIEAADSDRCAGFEIESDQAISTNTARRIVDVGGRLVTRWH